MSGEVDVMRVEENWVEKDKKPMVSVRCSYNRGSRSELGCSFVHSYEDEPEELLLYGVHVNISFLLAAQLSPDAASPHIPHPETPRTPSPPKPSPPSQIHSRLPARAISGPPTPPPTQILTPNSNPDKSITCLTGA